MIIKPLISEKSLGLAQTIKHYTFLVGRNTTKYQIKKAVEEVFGVEVKDVKTGKVVGGKRRVGRRKRVVRTSDLKKAIVKLSEKDKIDIFESKEKGKSKKGKDRSKP